MVDDVVEMRTAELKKLVAKLEEFGKQLRNKITFQRGQVELVDDLLKQLSTSIDDINNEESAKVQEKKKAVERAEGTKNLRGVKTPKLKRGGR